MSDYCHNKVVRLKVPLEKLNITSVYDLEEKYRDLFSISEINKFDTAPTEEPFIDYVLYHTYGEECGDWGRTRDLSKTELDKYIPIFKQIYSDVTAEDLRYVDYCYYNCSEAPGYFDAEDDFHDEI